MTAEGRIGKMLPGLAIAAIVALLALAIGTLATGVPVLALCVAGGIVLANTVGVPEQAKAGLQFASKRLLRVGIVLLGFQLSLSQLADLGLSRILLVVATVSFTFAATLLLGKALGLSRPLTLLTATGFSICGASAIAAARDVVDADEDETAYAVALVTLCGSLAIVLLPALGSLLNLHDEAYGSWVGASVHDVGQVVAAGAAGGAIALHVAVIVKLTRVVLLGPMLALLAFSERHRDRPAGEKAKVPLVPLFVVGFLVAICMRSSGLMGDDLLAAIAHVQTGLLALALVGLGAGVDLKKLRRLGVRPLLLGLGSWFVIAAVSYGGVVALG